MPTTRKDRAFLNAFFWLQITELAGNLLAAAAFLTGIVGPFWMAISFTSASMLLLLLVVPLALISAAAWFNGLSILAIPAGVAAIFIRH